MASIVQTTNFQISPLEKAEWAMVLPERGNL